MSDLIISLREASIFEKLTKNSQNIIFDVKMQMRHFLGISNTVKLLSKSCIENVICKSVLNFISSALYIHNLLKM